MGLGAWISGWREVRRLKAEAERTDAICSKFGHDARNTNWDSTWCLACKSDLRRCVACRFGKRKKARHLATPCQPCRGTGWVKK